MTATLEQLQKQVEVQCASLDSFHALQEVWRKREMELENEIDALKKENNELIKLGNRFEQIIKEGGKV